VKHPSSPHLMKTSILLLVAAAGGAFADQTVTEVITPEQMAALQTRSPFDELKKQQQASEKEAKVARPEGQSLIKQSEILHDGTHWTLIPKGAVLHVPAQMSPRVGTKPLGTLLPWDEFLIANRAWIQTEEVTFDQASGKTPLQDARKEFWQNQTKVIVAVHLGGPISVKVTEPATPAVTQK
jgi:hypothetical protein